MSKRPVEYTDFGTAIGMTEEATAAQKAAASRVIARLGAKHGDLPGAYTALCVLGLAGEPAPVSGTIQRRVYGGVCGTCGRQMYRWAVSPGGSDYANPDAVQYVRPGQCAQCDWAAR